MHHTGWTPEAQRARTCASEKLSRESIWELKMPLAPPPFIQNIVNGHAIAPTTPVATNPAPAPAAHPIQFTAQLQAPIAPFSTPPPPLPPIVQLQPPSAAAGAFQAPNPYPVAAPAVAPVPMSAPMVPYKAPTYALKPPEPSAAHFFATQMISESHAEMLEHSREQAKKPGKRLINKKDEELFVREYIRTGRNLELSIKRIGLPAKIADKFIKRPRVQELLRTWASVGLSAQDVTSDRVVQALGEMALFKPRELYDANANDGRGGLKPLSELTEDQLAGVDKILPNGGYTVIGAQTRLQALNQVAQVLGMNKTTPNVTVNQTTVVSQTMQQMPIEQLAEILRIQSTMPQKVEEEIIDMETDE